MRGGRSVMQKKITQSLRWSLLIGSLQLDPTAEPSPAKVAKVAKSSGKKRKKKKKRSSVINISGAQSSSMSSQAKKGSRPLFNGLRVR